jgi:2-amino-4-hydroxy-6-hydroxymethyldihydropteridine diphosphokinase
MSDPDYSDAAVVALGGNLPGAYASSAALLDAALARLAQERLTVLAWSDWWVSAAWPDASALPFMNGVALVKTHLSPLGLLSRLRAIECAFGREEGLRNAPRTLDLDLIAYGRRVLETPDLTLPHPRASERLFVMGPLAQVAPGWTHPVSGLTATQMAAMATVGCDAAPLKGA